MKTYIFSGKRTHIAVLLVLFAIPSICLSQTVAQKQRQFDFWLGEWGVNLRVRQKDFSWKDQHKSTARIYSILDGKAVFELWSENERGINGYSLRYYNKKTGKWDLWLNWAGNNRSATSGMECVFRHKRAECFSKRKIDETTSLISRYTFSDGHPDSVRWDDAYSRDGGKTWSNNWIMEFSRTKKTAPGFDTTPQLLTYFNGNRCNAPQFAPVKRLVDNHKNNSEFKLYKILDGCIAAGFIDGKKRKAFFTFTYNTFRKAYEFGYLDGKESSAFSLYYGNKTGNGFELQTANKKPAKASMKIGQKTTSIDLRYDGKKVKIRF